MSLNYPIQLFYEDINPDRWVPFDRYPRGWLRWIFRGAPRIGGQTRVFLNLKAGLDKLGVAYRINDYAYAKQHPQEAVGIVGKPQLLDRIKWKNPILFGAAVFSHPTDDPTLFERLPVKRVLVPGPWMKDIWDPFWGDRVAYWPVGIDTDSWCHQPQVSKEWDVLLYNKIRWFVPEREMDILFPIRAWLKNKNIRFTEIKYGEYNEEDYHRLLVRSRSMIFLCEYETQGIAYQQALSTGVPIMAWDAGGEWVDPYYYPRIRCGSVSSVPYWDDRCGIRFKDFDDFQKKWDLFYPCLSQGCFNPRRYILDHLTLEKAAKNKFRRKIQYQAPTIRDIV